MTVAFVSVDCVGFDSRISTWCDTILVDSGQIPTFMWLAVTTGLAPM